MDLAIAGPVCAADELSRSAPDDGVAVERTHVIFLRVGEAEDGVAGDTSYEDEEGLNGG